MPSQSRTSDRPVSLPSIHELFPEHLMHSPSSPSSSRTYLTVPNTAQRHTPSLPSPHYHSPAQPPPPHTSFARPAEPESAYHYPPQHYSNVNHAHSSRATSSAPRQLSAPHVSARPAGGPSTFPPSQQIPMPHHRDNDRYDHLGHPVVSIPLSHSERSPKGQAYPSAQSNSLPGSTHPPPPPDDPENLTDEDAPSTGPQSGIPRKHICPICHKAFNRPSSLKIHYNTHTGATPFRCPWPKCGREFNVNSNMRRHYRNHTTNANQESQDDGARRRRRRSSASSPNPPPSLPPIQQQSVGETRSQPQNAQPHHCASPSQYDDAPSSHTPDAPHQYSQYRVYDYNKDYHAMDLDEVDDYAVSEDPHHSRRLTVPVIRASQTLAAAAEPRGSEKPASRYPGAPALQHDRTLYHHHHSRSSTSSSSMRIRALTPGSSFHSSSPSPSPSPSLSASTSPFDSPPPSTLTSPANSPAILPRTHGAGQQYQYSPSMPYLRASGDPHVSTALRPAFKSGNTRQ